MSASRGWVRQPVALARLGPGRAHAKAAPTAETGAALGVKRPGSA